MNTETLEQCIDVAEFYDIDWYQGEFRALFSNDLAAEVLKRLTKSHQANLKRKLPMPEGQANIIAALAQAREDLAPPPEIAWFSAEHPVMVAAIAEAQKKLSDFQAQVAQDRAKDSPKMEEVFVKAFFPDVDDPRIGEHMYLDEIEFVDDGIRGVIMNEPRGDLGVEEGDVVTVPLKRISDWFYVINGKGYGGFTLKPVIESLSEEELQNAKQHPPLMWYA